MVGLEGLAGLVGTGFIDREVGGDFVLEAEFPFVGFGGVVLPEDSVGDGEGGIGLAFGIDAIGKVALRQV